MIVRFRFVTVNGDSDNGEKIEDIFYVNFYGPAKCQMNELNMDDSTDIDHVYAVAFTNDSAQKTTLLGHPVTQTDTRCKPNQKLQVKVDGSWVDWNDDNDDVSYISDFETGDVDGTTISSPSFKFKLTKDEYADMFSGSSETNYVTVRIVTQDSDSQSALGFVTDMFNIEISLGCLTDRIVPPPTIESPVLYMESNDDGTSSVDDLYVDLSDFETENPACRPYAKILVDFKLSEAAEY